MVSGLTLSENLVRRGLKSLGFWVHNSIFSLSSIFQSNSVDVTRKDLILFKAVDVVRTKRSLENLSIAIWSLERHGDQCYVLGEVLEQKRDIRLKKKN